MSKELSKEKQKQALKDLNNVNTDIQEILGLVNSLEEIDEDYDVESLDKKINTKQKELEKKYKDLLSKNNLDFQK